MQPVPKQVPSARLQSCFLPPQSNVSKVIRSMEDDMRTQLFVRHAKGIELTPEGERAYIHVQRILENMDELEMQAQPLAKSSLCVCFHPSSWFADTFVEVL